MVNNWTLTHEQFDFMLRHDAKIWFAYTQDDMTYLNNLEQSDEYRLLFGNMSFDEAIDRYECVLDRIMCDI